MTTITITGANQATEAADWLQSKNVEWNFFHATLADAFSERYHFNFKDPKLATEFALRWIK
jgi:hypothetical protein